MTSQSGALVWFKRRESYLVLILWAIALCGITRNLLTPRLLMINDPLLRAVETDQLTSNGAWVWITRALYLYTVVASLMLSVWGFFTHRTPLSGRTVWIAFLIFSCGPFVASVLGAEPGIFLDIFLFPLVLTSFFMNGDIDGQFLLPQIRRILLIFIYGSLLAIAINPLWAIQVPYLTGIFPIPIRLFGLAESPQRLGPMLLLYVMVERILPTRGWKRFVQWTAWAIVLVLAQEKVTLISCVMYLGLFLIEPAKKYAHKNPISLLLTGSIILLAFLASSIIVGANPIILHRLIEKGQNLGVDTFTGRTGIWEVTLTTWREYPIFGYGPTLWDISYRMKAGAQFMHVGMAHNQFVQSLGESGLFGFLCLTLSIAMTIYFAMKTARTTRWNSVALVLILLVPTITEAPFRNYFLGEDFLTALCVGVLLFHVRRFPHLKNEFHDV